MIRPVALADVSRVFELIWELAVYEKLEHRMLGSAKELGNHLFSDPPMIEGIVAELDGQVVGYALYYGTYSTFLTKPGIWLEDLYVSPSSRGRGLGKALFAAIAKIACKRGCSRMEWSVLDWNQPSIDFYEMNGAKPMSDWLRYLLSDEHLEKTAASSAFNE